MPDLWMPGATRIDVGGHQPTDGGPAKAIAHITWDRNATAAKPQDLLPYKNLQDWFGKNPTGIPSAPHILWNPFTGQFTQFVPANMRSKSLADGPGGTRTNRAGRVVIQVETLFFPYCRVNGVVYARLVDTPMKGWPHLLAWIRSWGVPDVWPMGRPVDFNSRRSESVWASTAGWYAHAHVPENDHQDPGSWPGFTTTEEDMDATQAKQLAELHKTLVPYAGWSYKGKGVTTDAYGDLRSGAASAAAASSKADGLAAKVTALNATVTTLNATVAVLAKAVGDLHAGVDTATLVAELKKAIAAAVIDVDVTVTDKTPGA